MANKQLTYIENQRISYSKVVLCAKFIEQELTMFQGLYDKEKKRQLNITNKNIDRFMRMINPEIITKEESIDTDIDFMNDFFNASIQSEFKGIDLKFKNDFYGICAKNNIKL